MTRTRVSSLGKHCSRPSAIRLYNTETQFFTGSQHLGRKNRHAPDFVVTDEDRLESPQQRKAFEFLNFIVGQINGIKLVLKRNKRLITSRDRSIYIGLCRDAEMLVNHYSPTKVAPKFSITAILFPTLRQERESDCTALITQHEGDRLASWRTSRAFLYIALQPV